MHTLIGHVDGIVPMRIGLGACRLLHALLQRDENHVVAGGGFVIRAIGDRTRDGGGQRGRGRKRGKEKGNRERNLQQAFHVGVCG